MHVAGRAESRRRRARGRRALIIVYLGILPTHVLDWAAAVDRDDLLNASLYGRADRPDHSSLTPKRRRGSWPKRWLKVARRCPRAGPILRAAASSSVDGRIVARGFTGAPGQPHAEAAAARVTCGGGREPAAIFVTLEPCSFVGRTSSCAKTARRSWFRLRVRRVFSIRIPKQRAWTAAASRRGYSCGAGRPRASRPRVSRAVSVRPVS